MEIKKTMQDLDTVTGYLRRMAGEMDEVLLEFARLKKQNAYLDTLVTILYTALSDTASPTRVAEVRKEILEVARERGIRMGLPEE